MPGATPTFDDDETHELRWPAAVGDTRSTRAPRHEGRVHEVWHANSRAAVDVPDAHFDDCLVVAVVHNTGGIHHWLCPGVGIVRRQGSGWSTVPDPGHRVEELVSARSPRRIVP